MSENTRCLRTPTDLTHHRTTTCHSTHSFEWCLSEMRVTSITCNKLGTVKNALRRSSQFRQLEEKNKTKELVILRCGKPITSHAPCTMILPGERVIVRFVKPAGSNQQPLDELRAHTKASNQLVVFNVGTKGGRNITKISKNQALRSYAEFTVYAFQGEMVKCALKRDGRFLKAVFDKTCALSDISTNVITEMSSLVDDLNGKTFQIILLNRGTPPDSQSSSLEDLNITNDSQLSDRNSLTVPMNDSVNPDLNKLKISGFGELCSCLKALMRELFKNKFKDQNKSVALSDMYNLFRVEYGRSQGVFEVSTMKKLMYLSESVCQVRINGSPAGSGFLLFDTFVLTSGHVIEKVCKYNGSLWILSETVTVHFSFESLEQVDPGQQVLEVVAFEHGTDASGHICDWTLLRLGSDQGLPCSLLKHCGSLPQSGSICLIGHSHGGVKQFESTLILPADNRPQIVGTHFNENLSGLPDPDPSAVKEHDNNEKPPVIHFLADAQNFCDKVAIAVNNSRDVMYESCFYFGASGCPVFDTHCNIVAMHSGGFVYKDSSGQCHSIIEYGHPVSDILENMIIQLVRKGRQDVLRNYLLCPYKHHDVIKNNVKKVVSSRNYTEFKNAAESSGVIKDDTLNKFFQFICGVEAPEPMDTQRDSGISEE